jgi:hypothetical protein
VDPTATKGDRMTRARVAKWGIAAVILAAPLMSGATAMAQAAAPGVHKAPPSVVRRPAHWEPPPSVVRS